MNAVDRNCMKVPEAAPGTPLRFATQPEGVDDHNSVINDNKHDAYGNQKEKGVLNSLELKGA